MTFTVASNEFLGGGREKAEYTAVVTWDRLAEIAGAYLGKGQQVAIEGRLQTRSWDDDRGPQAFLCSPPSLGGPQGGLHLRRDWSVEQA